MCRENRAGVARNWRNLWRQAGTGLALSLLLWGGVAANTADQREAPGPAVPLTVHNNLVSARLEHVALKDALNELARQARLTVYIAASTAQQRVSVTFEALPLMEGIKRLLEGKNYVLLTEPTPAAAGKPAGKRLTTIRVLSSGEAYTKLTGEAAAAASARTPAAPESATAGQQDTALEKLKRDVLEATEASARIEALEALHERQRTEADLRPLLRTVLKQDKDPEVRETALGMLPTVVVGEQDLLEQLAEVAQTDSSAELRQSALTYLLAMRSPAAQGHLQQALQDADPEVRELAKQLLESTASPEQPSPGTQNTPKKTP